jgi:hypothetical protein
MDPSKPWGDACNSDGTLKDASDMNWDEPGTSESEVSLLRAKAPATASVQPVPQKQPFHWQFVSMNSKVDHYKTSSSQVVVNTAKRPGPSDADIVPPAAKRHAGIAPDNSQNRKDIPKAKTTAVKKKKLAPIDRVRPVDLDVSKPAPRVVQKRAKDATHDVLTVFTKINPEDEAEGHRCEICS